VCLPHRLPSRAGPQARALIAVSVLAQVRLVAAPMCCSCGADLSFERILHNLERDHTRKHGSSPRPVDVSHRKSSGPAWPRSLLTRCSRCRDRRWPGISRRGGLWIGLPLGAAAIVCRCPSPALDSPAGPRPRMWHRRNRRCWARARLDGRVHGRQRLPPYEPRRPTSRAARSSSSRLSCSRRSQRRRQPRASRRQGLVPVFAYWSSHCGVRLWLSYSWCSSSRRVLARLFGARFERRSMRVNGRSSTHRSAAGGRPGRDGIPRPRDPACRGRQSLAADKGSEAGSRRRSYASSSCGSWTAAGGRRLA